MFCPNCGHKVDPNQKFCDNCGYALKKKPIETSNTETNETKDNDTIRSLSEIEKELNQEDPNAHKEEKPVLEQAPAQKREFDHNKVDHSEKEPEVKTFNQSNRSSFQKNNNGKEEPLDDRTQVYNKNDFNPISQKPYEQKHQHKLDDTFDDPIKEPLGDPFKPTQSEIRAAKAKAVAEQVDPNDGFIHNMIKFAKNNAFISILAVIIVAVLLVFKRNYGFIALAIVIILWFLLSQLGHGNETGANKALKRETSLKKPEHEDTGSENHYESERKEPRNHKATAQERLKPNHKTTAQKVIIFSSIVGFIASIGGPFLNGVSLTSTISTAANYTANMGAQSVWITNGFSAIRLICFLSPIIALIAACFRARGTIRLVRIFTVLPTILYAALYGSLYAGLVNSTAITGQVAVTTNGSFGTSFYVLLVTSIVSMLMAYSLRPKVR
ncbi:zinc-ribbon domain-containing protein [Companilactobacillus suantsaicola]|uniref:Zinc-ribbon domain-containing protein n=1 Tax=Companilactobacillus suantsaicola TaxID=2487723 RepID=A0A4Z0JKQ5_9LACO|nr:zinc ribbon domain-containing protein [Companilactobacillus suantsaicola]TGD23646.1 zinc-ribbon domain-containing protein [Companilactobacillus suantsaicola]